MPSQLAQLDGLIARLPTLGNRDLIDSAAVEFCYVNSKNARKRLVKVRRMKKKKREEGLSNCLSLEIMLKENFNAV